MKSALFCISFLNRTLVSGFQKPFQSADQIFILKSERGEIMKIEHAALYAEDLEKARTFFTDLLGGTSGELYHNPKTGFRSYFISFDDGARLEIMNKPDLIKTDTQIPHTGYAHLAFSVGSREEVDRLSEKLKSCGYPILNGPRTTGDGYYESVIASVEGNPIEITI